MYKETLSKILNDKVHIDYWHQEEIAKCVNLPVGSLNDLSRMICMIRDGRNSLARDFIAAKRKSLDVLEGLLETGEFSAEFFDEFTDCFATFQAGVDEPLPFPQPEKSGDNEA